MNLPFFGPLFFFTFLFLSGLFSLTETAFLTLNHSQLQTLKQVFTSKKKKLEELYDHPQKVMTTLLVASNLTYLTACIVATRYLLVVLEILGIHAPLIQVLLISLSLSLVIVVVVHILAKAIGIKFNAFLLPRLTGVITLSLFLFYPFTLGLNAISFIISKTFSLSKNDFTRLRLGGGLLEMPSEEEVMELKPMEQEMVESIFEVSETVVRQIMTPRTDMICLDVKTPLSKCIQAIVQCGHSRIPIFEDKIDNIIGILYAKDLLGINDPQASLHKYIRPAIFIPETKNCVDLLHQMKKSKFLLALVVDEYGGISGLITLEDIIEEIIGDVQDEFDRDYTPDLVRISPHHYQVSAGINIEDLADELGIQFPEEEDYDTLAGFALSHLGKFPVRGDGFTYGGFHFKIKEVSKRRIITLEIEKAKTESEDDSTSQTS